MFNKSTIDFIINRLNDFERLLRNEPFNYTAIETVRLCRDILFRLGVNFCCVNGVWRKL